jgi:hypothetical protein
LREKRRLKVFKKRGGDKKEWRKLNKGELNDLYFSPDIILVIKSKRIRRVGHVRMGDS